jgi:hypothetical protein
MSDREIIMGLMLKLEDEDVNYPRLIKRIGVEKFKEWDKAYEAAIRVLIEELIVKQNYVSVEDMLEFAVDNEYYEKAVMLRDYLNHNKEPQHNHSSNGEENNDGSNNHKFI